MHTFKEYLTASPDIGELQPAVTALDLDCRAATQTPATPFMSVDIVAEDLIDPEISAPCGFWHDVGTAVGQSNTSEA